MSYCMKANVYMEKHKLKIEDQPIPIADEDDVVITVSGCSVCGTDKHIYDGEVPLARPPVVLGHEMAGIVHDVGKNVNDLEKGQFVCIDPVIPCNRCQFCQSAMPNLCENMTVLGYHITGGFAQYTKAPRSNVYLLSPKVGVKGGILVEPLACILHGYDRLNIQAGASVLLLGAGPIGLIWTQLLKLSPQVRVVQTDKVPMRCEAACRLGSDHVINISGDSLEEYVNLDYPEGFDYVIDVTGDPVAVEEGIQYVKPGGSFMVFGVSPEHSKCNVDPYLVFNKEIKIIGSKMPPYTTGRAVKLVESGRLDLESIVSHEFALSELEDAFDLFENSKDKVLKMMINPWKE